MFRTATVFLAITLAVGCRRAADPAPESSGGNEALVNYARKNAPVLDRTLIEEDLRGIGAFMMTFRAEQGRLPRNWAELKTEMQRDAYKLVAKIEAGDYVINYQSADGGVLAYDTRYSDQLGRRIILRSGGAPDVVSRDEFEKLTAKIQR